MHRFLVKRFLQAIVVMLGVTAIVFLIIFLSGDPVYLMLPPNATTEDAAVLRQQLGLNDPLYVQYVRFLGGLVQGNFGQSLRFHSPALPLLLERLPATLQLAGTALVLSLLVALPAGILAALKKDSPLDLAAMLVALFGQSMPSFWLGLMLILLFAVHLGWLPTSGRTGPESVVLPAVTLALFFAGRIARITRSSMLEVLHEDYVRTARAKGLHEWVVINKHALKNAALPVVTTHSDRKSTRLNSSH